MQASRKSQCVLTAAEGLFAYTKEEGELFLIMSNDVVCAYNKAILI